VIAIKLGGAGNPAARIASSSPPAMSDEGKKTAA
jgi:hypothetical protein